MIKKDGDGLGLSMEGGKEYKLGEKKIIIKKILKGGYDEKNGKICEGDELISVNG
jgi:hypothetical protein